KNFVITYHGGDGNDVVLLTAPNTYTWDGGGANNNWTTAANWVGDVAPSAGDQLVFPDLAARLNNVNDFAAGTPFASITLSGTGYLLSGNAITLGVGGLTDSGTGDFNNQISLDLVLPADRVVTVSGNDGTLYLTGAISGAGGLLKLGESWLGFA